MDRIIVDNVTKQQIFGSCEPAVLCDASGAAFGHFVPIVSTHNIDNCPYTAEQLTIMRQESEEMPLADAWKSLGVS